MKRKHQRILELIFSRPVSGSLPWRDIEALFQELGGDVSERAQPSRGRPVWRSQGLPQTPSIA
jgi:hypothetical protein